MDVEQPVHRISESLRTGSCETEQLLPAHNGLKVGYTFLWHGWGLYSLGHQKLYRFASFWTDYIISSFKYKNSNAFFKKGNGIPTTFFNFFLFPLVICLHFWVPNLRLHLYRNFIFTEVIILSQLWWPFSPCQLRPAWSEVCINQLDFYFWLSTLFNLSKCNCSHPNIHCQIRAFSFFSMPILHIPAQTLFLWGRLPGASNVLMKPRWEVPPVCSHKHTHFYHYAQNTDQNFWRLLFYILSAFISTPGQEASLTVFIFPGPT